VQHLATGIAPMLAGLLITVADDGKMSGFPIVGYVAVILTLCSLILAGRLRSAKAIVVPVELQPEPTPIAEPVAAA